MKLILFAIFIFIAIYILTQALGVYMGYEPGGLGFMGVAFILSGIPIYLLAKRHKINNYLYILR